VTSGEVTSLTILLVPQEVRGKEVVVVSQVKGQLAAINQQISSSTIVNIVSEEKIQELPDANAAEAIGRLPGVSIIRSGGEASKVVLRGLSSKFSNITVDGVTIPGTDSTSRDVDLSMISQGSLAGIELYKALLPDQDGDAIAGTINLVTKKAPSERLLRFDLKGDYNRLMNSAGQYDFSGRYGERFFNGVLGVQLQGNVEQKIRSNENTSTGYLYLDNDELPGYDPAGPYRNDYKIGQFNVAFTDETRKRQGGQAIFDLDTPDSGSVKLSGLYDGTTRNILNHSRVYPAGSPGVVWDYDYRYTEVDMSTANASLQGKNFLSGFEVDWLGSYAQSKVDNPYDYALKFTEVPGVISGESVPSGRDHPENNIIPYAANLYSDAACSSAVYYQEQNFEKQRAAALNLSRRYTVADVLTGDFKLGAKYKDRSRSMDQSELDDNTYLHGFYSTNADGSPIVLTDTRFQNYFTNRSIGAPSLSDFIDLPVESRALLGLYNMSPLIDVNAMKQWYELNKNGVSGAALEYNPSAAALLNHYSIDEGVSAAYAMNTFDIGQLATLMMGVRVEKENDDYGARFATGGLQTIGIVVSAPKGTEIKDTTANYTETIWLPNAQLIVRPTDFLSVRFAAYRALARPDYNLRLPQFVINNTSQGTPLIMGNPNLKDPEAWNFEVNPQIYSNSVGLISISAFFKRIDDMYHQMQSLSIGPTHDYDSVLNAIGVTWQNTQYFTQLGSKSSFLFTVPYNSPQPTYVWGLEFEHEMNFLFLPGYLANISLSYNFSITHSQTYIIMSESVSDSVLSVHHGDSVWTPSSYNIAVNSKRNSEDQPVFYGNVALGYDIGGFSARISVFFQSQYTQLYSANGTSDIRVDPFSKVDLALRQQISRTFSLYFNIDNLTNRQETTSQVNTVKSWSINSTRQLYGTSGELGLRVTL
jgi:TonB-dependent receptor